MPNVSRGHPGEHFRKKISSRLKRFGEWLKRLILVGRADWRKASDDAKPPRLTMRERAAYEPHFDVNAIKPRAVSAADIVRPPSRVERREMRAPPPTPAPPSTSNSIDPAQLAAAIQAVRQSHASAGEAGEIDPVQVAAALQMLQTAEPELAESVPPAPDAAAERPRTKAFRRKKKRHSREAQVNPMNALDPLKNPPTQFETLVHRWLGRR